MFNLTIGNLTEKRCQEIKRLQMQCALVDGYTYPVYEEFWPQRIQASAAIDMFVWEKTNLIAYAGIFFFNPNQPEVVLLVDPSRRCQGIAKTLLQQVHRTLAELAIFEFLLLSIASQFSATLSRYQGCQHHVESHMQAHEWITHPVKRELTLHLAGEQDLECLVAIHQTCFNSPEANNRNRFAANLKEDNYFAYILYQQDLPIAKLHLRANAHETKLLDIGVVSHYQHQGYGSDLMQTWFSMYGKQFKSPFVIEIMSDNITALKLYQKCGFKIILKLVYWRFVIPGR